MELWWSHNYWKKEENNNDIEHFSDRLENETYNCDCILAPSVYESGICRKAVAALGQSKPGHHPGS